MHLEIFVPGPLRNPMNGSRGHWAKHARWARDWRERTTQQLLVCKLMARRRPEATVFAESSRPKVIMMTACTARSWDPDGLPAGLKPVLDGLRDAGVIHSDAADSGHQVSYRQKIARDHRGVEITIDILNANV